METIKVFVSNIFNGAYFSYPRIDNISKSKFDAKAIFNIDLDSSETQIHTYTISLIFRTCI